MQIRDGVRAAGETRIEALAHLGEWTRTPRFSPDGKTLYYTERGPGPAAGGARAGAAAVLRRAGAGARAGAARRSAPRDALFRRRGRRERGGGARRTRRVRARAGVPGVRVPAGHLRGRSKERRRAAADARAARAQRRRRSRRRADLLWRKPGGRTAIAEQVGGAPRVIFEDPDGEPVDSPRVSPDGAQVAFLHHRDGAWDVRIAKRDGSGVRDVTHDRALDRDPSWTADGKWLLFSSDRTGVYNVYAWSPDAGLRQVTNVVLGAFEPQPSPDGSQLALVTYSARGYDLSRMPLLPETWQPVTAAPVADERPAPAAAGGRRGVPVASILARRDAAPAFLAAVRQRRRVRHDARRAHRGLRRHRPPRIRRHRLVEPVRQGARLGSRSTPTTRSIRTSRWSSRAIWVPPRPRARTRWATTTSAPRPG